MEYYYTDIINFYNLIMYIINYMDQWDIFQTSFDSKLIFYIRVLLKQTTDIFAT